jgi:GT2 family glycosyltransferase
MNLTASVIVLCQPAETTVTALTLRHLVRGLEPTTTVHVLINGGFAGELRAVAPDVPAISYHSSPTNLGVAGGRNFLLRLPDVQASDVVVILDNDVITPPEHVARLVEAVASDPDAGVIGPAVLQLRSAARSLGLTDAQLQAPITNQRLAELSHNPHGERLWFHLGTHPDWKAVYVDELQLERRLLRHAGADVESFPAMNHQDPMIRAALADGATEAIPTSNVAGCCQAFRRELLDEIGLLRDEFSPYGYEDVDFCIRAAQTGKRNYVDPGILMLHGTDERHVDRRSSVGTIATQRNFMRCKSLLAWQHANAGWQAVVERSILRHYLLARQTRQHRTAAVQLRAHVAGSVDAQRQIRHVTARNEALR